jgi:hypothetical protein
VHPPAACVHRRPSLAVPGSLRPHEQKEQAARSLAHAPVIATHAPAANASAADSRELTLKLERLCRQMQEQLRVANEASGGWQKRYQLMERQVDALKEITSVSGCL